MMAKKPFFSVIIPAAKDANAALLGRCLTALFDQTYFDLEVIVVTSPAADNRLFKTLEKFPRVRVVKRELSKTAARNFGASKAQGNYLLHIDIDYILGKKVLSLTAELIQEGGAKAVILAETIKPSKSVWQEARRLEREVLLDDPKLSTPQLIERRLFRKIGGFDERIDALDDWVLNLKLRKEGVAPYETPPLTYVYEPTNPAEIFKRRYNKGRYLPHLKRLYGDAPQTRLAPLIKAYLKNISKIVARPQVGLALLVLKFLDYIPFFLGTLHPIRPEVSTPNPYEAGGIAEGFDAEQRSNCAKYKHHREVKSLFKLLGPPTGKILELGAGTGRITAELIKKGYDVTPTDISEAMLAEFKKKKGLPKPILIKEAVLPFSDNQFDRVIAVRVIWHIVERKEREKFLEEAIRVAKKSVILDFTNDKRYKKPLIRFVLQKLNPSFFENSYFFSLKEIEKLAAKHKAKVEELIPLDVLTPLWLNLLPSCLARSSFPVISRLEDAIAKILPPGRFVVKISLK